MDISALTKHFLNVEFIRTEEEIKSLEEETEKYYSKEETGWPIGIMDASKPLNRFQGFLKEFFWYSPSCGVGVD